MLHSPPPLDVGDQRPTRRRCLLRDVGGHGALPADPAPLYGADAATTRCLLERILRGNRIAPSPSFASSSSAAAGDADPAEREVPAGSVPSTQVRGDDTAEGSGAGTSPATALPRAPALPADLFRLYGDDAATTTFLLERILRSSGIGVAPAPLPNLSPSSAAAVDTDPAEGEAPAGSASASVPSTQVRGDDPAEGSGAGTPPATALPRAPALPADLSRLYGDDAATTTFLLERILRSSGIGIAPAPYLSSSSAAAVDADQAEDEVPEASPSVVVPSAQDSGDGTTGGNGSGTPPPTSLPGLHESADSATGSTPASMPGQHGRVLIVANRLPVTFKLTGEKWGFVESTGGLVSALKGVAGVQMMWVGWPGVSIPDKDQTNVKCELKEMGYIPIFLDEGLVDQYYSGYCNNILWPLFHYMGLPQDYKLKKAKDYESQLEAYEKANKMFADEVLKNFEAGDIVWCHDYHLMLLPRLLKENSDNKMKVGWFLHTPFPSPEIYRALPDRENLLEAVLASDLVGFQTYDYARHFVSACSTLLGLESHLEGVEFKGRIVKVEAFPIGIDFSKFKNALELPDVQEKIDDFTQLFAGRKVILGVDRFDMIKGLLQKVLAFEKFLEENMDMKEKVVLIQIAVPTRSEVPEYRKLASQVHKLVARVNGRFGTLKTNPIHHLDRTLDFHALCALYAVTDVALVTSLRDGMNLVSYEYVACQESKKGVLILSEFAGAAQSLGAGAIVVNPWDTAKVAKSINDALNMPADKREKRHRHNYGLVSAHSAQVWAEDYVRELHNTATKAPPQIEQPIAVIPIEETASRYAKSRSRLLILGFNETLTEQITDQIANAKLKLNPELKEPLKTLCDDEDTTVIVVSGYDKIVLSENFGEFKMWLAAENGMFLRQNGEEWIVTNTEHLEIGCSDSVKKCIEYFTRRTPNSYEERRETSFVWNYKHADDAFGRQQAKDMLQHLGAYSSSSRSVDIVQGRRSIEVRPVGVTKGNAVKQIIRQLDRKRIITSPIDYVLCIGHFLAKDEDVYTLPYIDIQPDSESKAKGWQADCMSTMFNLKAENYISYTVGREHSLAQYKLEGTNDVLSLLRHLAGTIRSLP